MEESKEAAVAATKLCGAIEVKEEQIRSHLSEIVRGTVEETLNAMLEADADRLCRAGRYERSEERASTRAGSYNRRLHTQAGEVTLKVPKLRSLRFETAIIERYRRRESSVEEALIEMYIAGVSVRRVEDITEALWGTRVSASTVSELNKKLYEKLETWLSRPIEGEHKYVFMDGMWLKRTWGGEVENVSVLIAIGVDAKGFREVLAVREGSKEDAESWRGFLRHMKERGLHGVELVVSDKSPGLLEVLADFFPEAKWQRCATHFYRNVLNAVPRGKRKTVAAALKAIHASEDRTAAEHKALLVADKLAGMKLEKAAKIVREGARETFSYYAFPREHWRSLRTNNPMERIIREVRRRTRVVGAFPDGQSAVMLVAARLRHIGNTQWGTRCYLDPKRFAEQSAEERDDLVF